MFKNSVVLNNGFVLCWVWITC